jgi:RNA polymerase sigma-70 factor (ECF subfamily)
MEGTAAEQEGVSGLAQRAASGDAAAFTLLVEQFGGEMVRVAYGVCGDLGLAEDAAQSAWSIAWRKLGALREPTQVRAWLLATAANEARQLIRTAVRRRRAEVKAEPGSPPDRPDDRVLALSLLQDLDDRDRMLVVLRHLAGLTSAEIATAVGMRPGAVRVRLHRSIKRIREAMADA